MRSAPSAPGFGIRAIPGGPDRGAARRGPGAAKKLVEQHHRFLFDGFNTNLLELRNGLIAEAIPSGPDIPAAKCIPALFALRPAFALRLLSLQYEPGSKVLAALSRRAPRSLRHLKFWLGSDCDGLGPLAHDGLETLHLYLRPSRPS